MRFWRAEFFFVFFFVPYYSYVNRGTYVKINVGIKIADTHTHRQTDRQTEPRFKYDGNLRYHLVLLPCWKSIEERKLPPVSTPTYDTLLKIAVFRNRRCNAFLGIKYQFPRSQALTVFSSISLKFFPFFYFPLCHVVSRRLSLSFLLSPFSYLLSPISKASLPQNHWKRGRRDRELSSTWIY